VSRSQEDHSPSIASGPDASVVEGRGSVQGFLRPGLGLSGHSLLSRRVSSSAIGLETGSDIPADIGVLAELGSDLKAQQNQDYDKCETEGWKNEQEEHEEYHEMRDTPRLGNQ